jgi:hypothetical protein
VDVCGWILGTTCHFERVLALCVSLHRLSSKFSFRCFNNPLSVLGEC